MPETLSQKTLDEVLRTVKPGERLRIVFRADALDHLIYLRAMHGNGLLKLEQADEALLISILAARSWGDDRNRTFVVEVTQSFNPTFFKGRLERALEKIEAA